MMNLKECYTLVCKQKANLRFEELLFILSEMQEEILLRTSVICETIPSDVWMNIFSRLSEIEDLSFLMSLKSVCKHLYDVFSQSQSQLTTVIIHKKESSLNWIPYLPNIKSFTIDSPNNIISLDIKHFDKYLTNLVTLKLGKDVFFENYENLPDSQNPLLDLNPYDGEKEEKLDIRLIYAVKCGADANIELTKFLDNFNQVKEIKFPLLNTNCYYFQKKYPHIRFRWYIKNKTDKNKIQYDIYEGGFNETHKFEGKGVLNSQVSKYDGEWKNGEKDGRGIEISYTPNGFNRYEGEWRSNKKNGQGIINYDDGSKYEGEWKNSWRNGKGISYYPDGSIQYIGEYSYKHDSMSGKGIYYYKNGDRYEGDFKIDQRDGKGNYFHSDGGRYEGPWICDLRESIYGADEIEYDDEGIYYFPNGNKYVGEFRKNKFHGSGIYYYSNGSRFEGEWYKGEREDNGEGIYYDTDGSKHEGKWKKDEIGNYHFEDGSICEREWKYPKKRRCDK